MRAQGVRGKREIRREGEEVNAFGLGGRRDLLLKDM